MNILFISLLEFKSIKEKGIYTDLLREFRKLGHEIYVISPVERRNGKETTVIDDGDAKILRLTIGNIQKTNIIGKGITTLTIERSLIRGIKKYFADVKFDLVLYPTPPITFCGAAEYVKKRDGACTYLMLKDIFPQNAVDLGMLKKTGLKGLIYSYFRAKEKKLYRISDIIGCMSPANIDYVIEHNEDIPIGKLTECPKALEIVDKSVDVQTRIAIREKYDIPLDKKVFIYGGNLGKPQGIKHLVACIDSQKDNEDAFFLIIGSGTEQQLMSDYAATADSNKVKYMSMLPKEDYDTLVGACDVGLIFLDHRFTIPNSHSRLLSYMQAKLPVLAVIDANTDMGRIIEAGNFGWWCESDDVSKFVDVMKRTMDADLSIGQNGFEYMEEHYNAKTVAKQILAEVEHTIKINEEIIENKIGDVEEGIVNPSSNEESSVVEARRTSRVGIVLAILAMLTSLIVITNKVTLAIMDSYSNSVIYWGLSSLFVGLVAMLVALLLESIRYIWCEARRCDLTKKQVTSIECDKAYSGLLFSCKLYIKIIFVFFLFLAIIITYYSRKLTDIIMLVFLVAFVAFISIYSIKKNVTKDVFKKTLFKIFFYVICWGLTLFTTVFVLTTGKDRIQIVYKQNGTIIVEGQIKHEYDPFTLAIYEFDTEKKLYETSVTDGVLLAKSTSGSISTIDDKEITKASSIKEEQIFYRYKMNLSNYIHEDGKYIVEITTQHESRNASILNSFSKEGKIYIYSQEKLEKTY